MDLPHSTHALSEQDVETLSRVLHVRGDAPDMRELGRLLREKAHFAQSDLYGMTWRTIIEELRGIMLGNGKAPSGRSVGRPKKYSEQTLQLAQKAFDEALAGDHKGDHKGAWNRVAELYSFPSGDAARKQVEGWKEGRK